MPRRSADFSPTPCCLTRRSAVWALGLCGLICGGMLPVTWAIESVPPAILVPLTAGKADLTTLQRSTANWDLLVGQLDDESFAVREHAAAQLISGSDDAAIDLLAQAVQSQSTERSWRAGEVLHAIALENSETHLDKIHGLLEKLAAPNRPAIKNLAQDLAGRRALVRSSIAIAELRKLGAEFPADEVSASIGVEIHDGAMLMDWEGGEELRGGMVVPVPGVEILEEEDIAAELDEAAIPAAMPEEADDLPDDAPDDVDVDVEVRKFDLVRRAADLRVEALDFAPVELAIDDVMGFDLPVLGGLVVDDFDLGDVGEMRYAQVILGAKWTGGIAGLKWLADIPELSSVDLRHAEFTDEAFEALAKVKGLQVVSITGTKITATATRKFSQDRGNVVIQAQPAVKMGIVFNSEDEGKLSVIGVEAGSSAAAAGVHAGDELLLMAGEKPINFLDVKTLLIGRKAEEKLAIKLVRDGAEIELELILKAGNDTSVEQDQIAPAVELEDVDLDARS